MAPSACLSRSFPSVCPCSRCCLNLPHCHSCLGACSPTPTAEQHVGVSAVNFLGLSRLVAKILLKVGMLKDSETKKAGLLLAGQSYAKVFLLDNLGVLQYAPPPLTPQAALPGLPCSLTIPPR